MSKSTEGSTKESSRHGQPASPFFKSGASRAAFFQPKLQVNAPGDHLEQQADLMADRVMAAEPPAAQAVQRKCEGLPQPEAGGTPAPGSVEHVVGSAGRALDQDLRHEMEQRFHSDFSQVRVHSDAAAEQSARDVKAHAYTVGDHIVFGAGQLAPQTPAGKRLLAHELTHVVQQSAATTKSVQRAPDGATDINGTYDVEWKINEGTAKVTYGKKSTTVPLGSRESAAQLTRELGITKPQAATVLRDIHANVPRGDKLLISFVQNVGNPRDYAVRRFREMRAGDVWHSDALAKPPVEGIRRQIRVSGAGTTALELSEYGYVFFETKTHLFEPKPSGTAQGIQEYQHLNVAKNRTPAITAPLAVVRVNEYGKIIEIVEHALSGSPDAVRGKLVREFENAGWKTDFSATPPRVAGAPPPPPIDAHKPPDMRKLPPPIDAHKPPDMGKKPAPIDAHKPPDMGKKPSPMDAHKPPDMGKQPSPMDAHKPPDMTPGISGGGVSRFRAAGRFLAREAPGLALQAVFMLIFPPGVIFRHEKLVELNAKKINPAAEDALVKQQAVYDKLFADDPAKAIYANFSVRLDYSINVSSHGDLILELKDMTLVDVKITRDNVSSDPKKFNPTSSFAANKQITTSMLLYESAHAAQIRAFNEDLQKYRECLQQTGAGQGAGAPPGSHCIPPKMKPIK